MSVWGHLEERYTKPRKRRLLALEGGGIRGVLSLGILAEVESQLREQRGAGEDFRLCHYFDYIAGTSTGAIIAACLAVGKSVGELTDFYRALGPKIFDKASLLKRLKNLYKKGPLEEQLQAMYGENSDLSSPDLQCLLLVVTRNVTTDSPWPISSNPLARYNARERPDCNLRIPLWKLVRASTAAPIFFPPEVIAWDENDPEKTFVFVDGGITPYNNPSFLLFRMATAAPYKLAWPTGEKNLMLVSVGTGAAPVVDEDVLSPSKNAVSNLAGLPGALMFGAQVDQDINCRIVGRCVSGPPIDREIGDLIPVDDRGHRIPLETDLGRAFVYGRYSAELSADGLEALGHGDKDPDALNKLDAIDQIDNLLAIGRSVGKKHVRMSDFGSLIED